MGWSEELRDENGNVIGIACGRGRRLNPCATPGCAKDHAALCDFPVVRDGRRTTCDRPMCEGHRHKVGPNRDLCGPHFRSEA